jgi:hypothetical protein
VESREPINPEQPPTYFWAKTLPDGRPGISVRDHWLNVGCVAEALIAGLPETVRALLPPGTSTLAALHDVGKISRVSTQVRGVAHRTESHRDRPDEAMGAGGR